MKAILAVPFWRLGYWSLGAGVLLCVILLYTGAPVRTAWAEGAGCSASLWMGCAAVLGAVRVYPVPACNRPYALCAGLAIGAAMWWLNAFLITVLVPDVATASWLAETRPVRGTAILLFYPAVALLAALNKEKQALTGRFAAQAETQQALREAELFKLRQQFQPHFLYNSLNSINALIALDGQRAQEMVGTLSDYLRRSVRNDETEAVALREELEHTQAYLAIETVRFGNRLRVELNLQADQSRQVPPFLLQPLLENAVKFGVYGTTGPVTVQLTVAEAGPDLVLTLENPYDALMRPPRGTGFGLRGLQRRLELLYGRTDLLRTTASETVFTATLRLPPIS